MKTPPARVGYVLDAFPEPSQTFVADEAHSLLEFGVQPCILHRGDGNRRVVHTSAAALLAQAPCYRLEQAGRAQAARALAVLLRRRPGHTLAALRKAASAPERWIWVQALPAAVWCLQQGIGFLHAHFADTNLRYAAAISAWTGIPYGVTTHRYDILDDPIAPAQAAALLREAHLVVTISEWNRRHMAAKYGLDPARIRLVRCGIDLDRFAFVPRAARPPGAPLRLLNVGRLVPIKAHDVLLRACAQALSGGVPLSLEIIGSGELEGGLHRLAAELGIADRVRFLGAQPEATVRERLRAADLFVLSSRSEGLPVACIEAMACGTPVIATRISGIPELIEDGVTGVLVDPDDVQALARAIAWAHAHPKQLETMTSAARQCVETHFLR